MNQKLKRPDRRRKRSGAPVLRFWFPGYKLRSGSKLVGAPLYMGFLYGVKIARLDDYMGFLYGAPPDLTVHFWAQKTQNNVSQKAQMLLQKIVTDSLPPPRFTASTTTLVSLPGRKPVLTTLARVPDPVVRVWTARKICVANPTQKKKKSVTFFHHRTDLETGNILGFVV